MAAPPVPTGRSAYKNLGLAHGFAPSELRAYAPMNARVRAYALIVKAVSSAASCFDAFSESIKKSGSSGTSVKLRVPIAKDVLEIVVKDFGPCL